MMASCRELFEKSSSDTRLTWSKTPIYKKKGILGLGGVAKG